MLNITAAAFLEKEVELVTTHFLFNLPEKPDIKALQKVLHKHISPGLQLEELYFGNYINVADDEDTFFVIGIRSGCRYQISRRNSSERYGKKEGDTIAVNDEFCSLRYFLFKAFKSDIFRDDDFMFHG